MMLGILDMSDQTVREVMSPRIDIVAVTSEASIGDVMKVVISSGFSRIPLYEDSIDRIIGVIYAKDLLAYLQTGASTPSLRNIARPPYFVPETKRIDQLLADLRRDQTHVAIVVDEYGGTAGLVTVEDVLEEIVGEIVDEYDTEEVEVERVSDEEAIVDARLAIDDLNDLFGTDVENEDFDTVGGLVFSLLGRLATPGDRVDKRRARADAGGAVDPGPPDPQRAHLAPPRRERGRRGLRALRPRPHQRRILTPPFPRGRGETPRSRQGTAGDHRVPRHPDRR